MRLSGGGNCNRDKLGKLLGLIDDGPTSSSVSALEDAATKHAGVRSDSDNQIQKFPIERQYVEIRRPYTSRRGLGIDLGRVR